MCFREVTFCNSLGVGSEVTETKVGQPPHVG